MEGNIERYVLSNLHLHNRHAGKSKRRQTSTLNQNKLGYVGFAIGSRILLIGESKSIVGYTV